MLKPPRLRCYTPGGYHRRFLTGILRGGHASDRGSPHERRHATIELPITGMTCASCVARDGARHRQGRRASTRPRQPGDGEGDGHVRPGRGLDRRPRRRRRRRAGYGVVTAQETLPIIGMTCASCVSRVEKALRMPRRRPQGRRQSGDGEGDRLVHPRPGDATRTWWRPCAAPATTSSSRRRGTGEEGVEAAVDAEEAARAAAYRTPQAQGHRRLRAQHRHLRRHDADGLVHRSCPPG